MAEAIVAIEDFMSMYVSIYLNNYFIYLKKIVSLAPLYIVSDSVVQCHVLITCTMLAVVHHLPQLQFISSQKR